MCIILRIDDVDGFHSYFICNTRDVESIRPRATLLIYIPVPCTLQVTHTPLFPKLVIKNNDAEKARKRSTTDRPP